MFFYIILSVLLYYLYDKCLTIYNLINRCYIYNQSWEDSEVDINTYQIKDKNNILMVTNGGDNVLNYLIQNPDHIHSVDLNKYQSYLLEMKMAIIRVFEWEEAFQILAKNDYKLFLRKFKALENHLSYECKRWWQENKGLMKNFHNSGTITILIYMIHTLIWLFGLKQFIEDLKGCSFKKQQELYFKNESKLKFIGNILNQIIVIIIPYMKTTDSQLYLSDMNPNMWIKRLFLYTNINKNYFYYPYLYGCWELDCCPPYLQKENYQIVKTNLCKIKNHTCRLDEIGKYMQNTSYKFDRVILLDHMDWITNALIVDEWNKILPYTEDDCLFCWRSYSFKQPFVCLSNVKYHVSAPIFPLYAGKVTIYNSIHVASINDKPLSIIKQPKYTLTFKQKLNMFSKMILSTFKLFFVSGNRDFMNRYYYNQTKDYDAYQFNILHGKKNMMYGIPFKKDMNILLLAGGTGDVLDYITDFIPQCKQITISDISFPMIQEARKKINKHKWTNVRAIQCDATKLQEKNKYDLIIISYAITMIPDWEKTLSNCKNALKDGGYLACSDFTIDITQNWISQQFWKFMLSFNRIYLTADHIHHLKKLFHIRYGKLEYGGFPMIPFLKCPYYYAIFQNKKDDNIEYYYC